MKKMINVIMVVMMVFSVAGCSAKSTESNAQPQGESVVQTAQVDLKNVLSDINTQYADVTGNLRELSDVAELEKYYTGPLWKQDFEADEAGQFPQDLKRGILSEDGIYNLIAENERWLRPLMEETAGREKEE